MKINITPEAVSHLKTFVSQQVPEVIGLRLAVAGFGCSGFGYKWAIVKAAKPGDAVLDFDGLQIFVDMMSALYLDGLEITWTETIEGGMLTYISPGKRTCGCGRSFGI